MSEWPRQYLADLMPGLPAEGPEALDFRSTPVGKGREGMVVKVQSQAQGWIGNFQYGDGGVSGIYGTPSPDYVCVVARGRGYWVPINDPQHYSVIKEIYPIRDAQSIRARNLLVFADDTDIAAYGASGLQWKSGRVSWDGITIHRIDDRGITGAAWDAATERSVGFFVDLETGRLEGGAAPENR